MQHDVLPQWKHTCSMTSYPSGSIPTHTFQFLHDFGVGLLVQASLWRPLLSAHHSGFILIITVLWQRQGEGGKGEGGKGGRGEGGKGGRGEGGKGGRGEGGKGGRGEGRSQVLGGYIAMLRRQGKGRYTTQCRK